MTLHSKSDKDLTNSNVNNDVVQKEFCVECYTELHYYDIMFQIKINMNV